MLNIIHLSSRHEGRSWYTSHRGRLWIHAASKEPDRDVISQMEEFYIGRNPGYIEKLRSNE